MQKKVIIKELLLISTISAFLLTLLIFFTDKLFPEHELFYGKWMHFGYIGAAENIFNYQVAPFCWRLLQPMIVNVLPLNQADSFFTISVISIFLTSIIVYKILRKLSFDKEYSVYGIVIFLSLVWAVRFNIMEFWYTESLLYLWIVLAIYFLYRSNDFGFMVVLVLGVLTKETMLLIIPLYYSIKNSGQIFGNFNKVLLFRTIIFSLPAICLFIVLREIICAECDLNAIAALQEFVPFRLESLVGLEKTLNYDVIKNQPQFVTASINIYRVILGAFGGLVLLPFLTFKQNKKYISVYIIFFTLAYLQIFFAKDIERLLTIAFFPVVLLSISTLYTMKENFNLNKNIIRLFVIIFFSVQIIFSKDIYQITYYSSFAQTVLCIVFILYVLWKRRRFNAVNSVIDIQV